jgi:hypothetical protein
MREYENDRWRIISTKVGSGFSPAACKERAAELASDSTENEGTGSRGETATEDTNTFDQNKPLESLGADVVASTFQ